MYDWKSWLQIMKQIFNEFIKCESQTGIINIE